MTYWQGMQFNSTGKKEDSTCTWPLRGLGGGKTRSEYKKGVSEKGCPLMLKRRKENRREANSAFQERETDSFRENGANGGGRASSIQFRKRGKGGTLGLLEREMYRSRPARRRKKPMCGPT